MKQNDIVVVLAAFAAYLILMVVIGVVYINKKLGRLFPWWTWTERMGGCFVCTGV